MLQKFCLFAQWGKEHTDDNTIINAIFHVVPSQGRQITLKKRRFLTDFFTDFLFNLADSFDEVGPW